MNAVLYTEALEPITVVDIPMWLYERLLRGDTIAVGVPPPFQFARGGDDHCRLMHKTVHIFGERLRRRGHETLMLFTRDEENALLLDAEFLPGQRREVQQRQRQHFAQGILAALDALSR